MLREVTQMFLNQSASLSGLSSRHRPVFDTFRKRHLICCLRVLFLLVWSRICECLQVSFTRLLSSLNTLLFLASDQRKTWVSLIRLSHFKCDLSFRNVELSLSHSSGKVNLNRATPANPAQGFFFF